MLRLLFASMFLSLGVQAAHLDTVCKSAIDNPPKFAPGFVSRFTPDGRAVIETIGGDEIYEARENIRSIVFHNDKIWALTYSQILELGKDGSFIKSHGIDQNKSMIQAGEFLIVLQADGRLVAFEPKTEKVIWTAYLDEVTGGLPVSMAFDGTNIQVIFATAYERGFTGVATVNLSGKITKKVSYESRKYGVIAPDAIANWHQGNLIINNGGWIHVIEAKQISQGKNLKPRWVSHRIPNEVNPHYMMLRGEFFFEGSTLVGCGSYRELASEHDWTLMTKLFRVQL